MWASYVFFSVTEIAPEVKKSKELKSRLLRLLAVVLTFVIISNPPAVLCYRETLKFFFVFSYASSRWIIHRKTALPQVICLSLRREGARWGPVNRNPEIYFSLLLTALLCLIHFWFCVCTFFWRLYFSCLESFLFLIIFLSRTLERSKKRFPVWRR